MIILYISIWVLYTDIRDEVCGWAPYASAILDRRIYTKEKRMEFINAESVRVYENPGVKSRQLLNPGNSASERITVTRVQVEPGAEQPRHTHENSEQVWIAVRGKGTLLLGDSSEKNICEGDVVRFADGDVHGLLNNSDEVFEYISVTSPPLDFSNVYVKR